MFSFANGLIIRDGERTLAFERQLDSVKVQFKYLDNFEIRTFSVGVLYTAILNKKIHVVSQNGRAVDLPGEIGFPGIDDAYKLQVDQKQEDQIEARLRYIKEAIKQRASVGSLKSLTRVARMVSERYSDDSPPAASTIRNWMIKYQRSGNNPYSLLDRRPLSHRPKRLTSVVEELIEHCISKHFLQLRGASVAVTYQKLVSEIKARERRDGVQIEVPSVRTIHRRIGHLDPYVVDLKRLGKSWADNKWRFSMAGDVSTRILERVEIDHTLLDIWVLDPVSGVPIGRPWITVLIDRFSGYPLGFYISFYGPSVASVAHAMRNAILPKSEIVSSIPEIQFPWLAQGVAEIYVLDNGLEFHAKAFRRLAWNLRADLIYNRVRWPWLKASIERVMMEFNRILPLHGKVYSPQKNVKPEDPKEGAAILFDDLCASLLMWAAEVFPRHIHPKTLVRPIDLWEDGIKSAPLPMFPVSLEDFEIVSGLSTHRIVGGDGVFFKYLRFNSYELQHYRRTHGETFRAEVRFNPDDLGYVHVNLPKAQKWLKVGIQSPTNDYGKGLSLIQHSIIRDEAGKKLRAANAEEELMLARSRLQDRWGNAVAKGVRIRKHASLIRMQGLTSAKVFNAGGESQASSSTQDFEPPQSSPAMEEILSKVMPFDSFSLDDDL